jgi:exoribonuclease-2
MIKCGVGEGELHISLLDKTEKIKVDYDNSFLLGLSVIDYTHSTAPNRRYPDLITQRLLRALLNNKVSPYSNEELEEIAQRASDQAQIINKVYRK